MFSRLRGKQKVPASKDNRVSAPENVLKMLKNFDTVFVIDDSGSMAGKRWKQAENALADLAPIASQFDTDGIEVHFFNDRHVMRNITTAAQVQQLFRQVNPTGRTPMGTKLEELLSEYISRLKRSEITPVVYDRSSGSGAVKPSLGVNIKPPTYTVTPLAPKPVNFIVITDGTPTDPEQKLPEKVIENVAKQLDSMSASITQVGIQFVQIGNDPNATKYLEQLDDELKGKGIRDMVDTTPFVEKDLDLIKALLGAINRRVDNKGSASVR